MIGPSRLHQADLFVHVLGLKTAQNRQARARAPSAFDVIIQMFGPRLKGRNKLWILLINSFKSGVNLNETAIWMDIQAKCDGKGRVWKYMITKNTSNKTKTQYQGNKNDPIWLGGSYRSKRWETHKHQRATPIKIKELGSLWLRSPYKTKGWETHRD